MYTNFLKSRTCYDIMPKSSKIVVFDTKLRVSNTSYINVLPLVPEIMMISLIGTMYFMCLLFKMGECYY